MTDNFIKLNNNDVLKLKIIDSEGNDTGEYLEFDLEDIELPLKYQELLDKDKKNREYLRNQFLIIDKRQDVKGKKLLSKNEEDKVRAINEFLKKQEEVYNLFLGKDGVKKLLNGRKLGWMVFDEINQIIEKQIAPHLDLSMNNITNKIREKYKNVIDKQEDVLR